MGQQQSAFVVEIASPRLGTFKSVPQNDPDEEEEQQCSQQWRITVNPAANFASNTELKSLIHMLNRAQVMLLQCIANMSVSKENNEILKRTIPLTIKRLEVSSDLELTVAFQALTNLSYNIAPNQVESFLPAIPCCLKRLWDKGEANLNSLRLLINLSCCPDMVPHILAARTVTGLLSILDTDKMDVLLRALTWLLCMSSAVEALSISCDVIAPLNQDPFANLNYTIYCSIYAPKGRHDLEKRLNHIACGTDEVALNAKKLLRILSKIPEAHSQLSNLNRL